MCERRYKLGRNRRQAMLLPPSVDDDVSEDSLAWAIDIDVDTLDLAALGLRHAEGGLTPGQPAYAPAHLLKLDLYGYLHRIRSSRRLQAQAERDLEIIWLLEGLRLGCCTIAEFRRTNAKALKAANREFVLLCRELDLVGGERLGIDGSHFNANANASDASVKTLTQPEREHAALEREIAGYHQELDLADTREDAKAAPTGAVSAKLDELTARQAAKAARIAELKANGETRISGTDPDARRLKKHGKSTVGHNVRSEVDDKHKLIVVAEATSAGNDIGQLAPMAKAAKSELGVKEAEVFADAGYWKEEPEPVRRVSDWEKNNSTK
jgi:transposase